MRPVEYTTESIIEAGQTLQAAGRNVTGFALRQKVGGGDASRLKQVWEEYVASKSVVQVDPVAELPIEVADQMNMVSKALTERLSVLAVELNDKAVKAAERRVTEVIRTAGEQREQAERELADASQTVDDLESQLDAARVQIEQLQNELGSLQKADQAKAVDLAQVRGRLEATEGELERSRQAEAEAEAEKIQAERRSEEFQVEVSSMKVALADVKAKLDAKETAYQEQKKNAANEAHRMAERLTKAKNERDSERKLAQVAREDLAKLSGKLEASEEQVSNLLKLIKAQESTSMEKKTTTKK